MGKMLDRIKEELEVKAETYLVDTTGIQDSEKLETFWNSIAAAVVKIGITVERIAGNWPRLIFVVGGRKKKIAKFEKRLGKICEATGTSYRSLDEVAERMAEYSQAQGDAEVLDMRGYSKAWGVPLSTVRRWCATGRLVADEDGNIVDNQGTPVKNPETNRWSFVMPDGSVR